MQCCWVEEIEKRPTFREIKEIRHTYCTVDVPNDVAEVFKGQEKLSNFQLEYASLVFKKETASSQHIPIALSSFR